MTNAQYVEINGGCCPKCGSGDTEGDTVEVDGAIAYQDIGCANCYHEWRDIFYLMGYED